MSYSMKKRTDIDVKRSHGRIRLLKPRSSEPRPCLFIDRDGTMIIEKHYLKNPEYVVLEKGAIDLLQKAHEYQYHIVIVTNQSGIGRGYFGWLEYEKVTDRLIELCDQNRLLSGIYANSCHPESVHNDWRKPNPGMLFRAMQDLNIDMKKSIFVGDRESDILAGINAGVGRIIHVLTGHGMEEKDAVMKLTNMDLASQSIKLEQKTGIWEIQLDEVI